MNYVDKNHIGGGGSTGMNNACGGYNNAMNKLKEIYDESFSLLKERSQKSQATNFVVFQH